MKSKIIILLLFLISGVTGYVIGRKNISEFQQSNTSDLSSQTSSYSSANPNESEEKQQRASTKAGNKIANGSQEERAKANKNKMELILRTADPLQRSRDWLSFIDQLDITEFADVMKSLRENGMHRQFMAEYGILISGWAKIDPIAALDFAKKNMRNPFASQTILATWASNDPDSAINWAKANHQGDGANANLIGIIQALAFTDTKRAEALLNSMPFSTERRDALEKLMPAILAKGIDQTREWINSIKDEKLRNGAIDIFTKKTINADPESTAKYLIKNSSKAANDNIEEALSNLYSIDPKKAETIFETLQTGELKTNALRGIMLATIKTDTKKAAALFEKYPNDFNDDTISAFGWNSFQKDTATAMTVLYKMKDPVRQERFMSRGLQFWLEKDQTAARNWLSKNQVSQRVLDQLNFYLEKK
jgi:hypothetical protein